MIYRNKNQITLSTKFFYLQVLYLAILKNAAELVLKIGWKSVDKKF